MERPPTGGSGRMPSDTQRRLETLKAKHAATREKLKLNLSTVLARKNDDSSMARGGLDVHVHPALLQDDSKFGITSRKGDRYRPMRPKFATTMANLRAAPPAPVAKKPRLSKETPDLSVQMEDFKDPSKNQYFDPNLGDELAKFRARNFKPLVFNDKGKYIEKAKTLRNELRVEELKRMITEKAKKAGLEEDLDMVSRSILREPPPEVEWWDLGLLTNATYDDLDDSLDKIESEDSLITSLVIHPVPISGCIDEGPTVQPLRLTKKEAKKLRRQNRSAVLKDKQDQQRLGLIPPDPPKVKLSNMMNVLGSEAIKDPTAVEARVRKEGEERKRKHELANEERKLTPEQRRQKAFNQINLDAENGIYCAVFKIKYLSHKLHRTKIDLNAQQLGLTGMVIMNPKFNMVVIEGGQKGLKKYKHLMLQRIDWTDFSRNSIIAEGNKLVEDRLGTLKTEENESSNSSEQDIDPNQNKCILVWEGQNKSRLFKFWKFKTCPTDRLAKEALSARAEHFWEAAAKIEDH